ncbi:MAG: thioether cross-link-forming SCIFF peptide maturase [Desulfotomaculaceae bacterium]|nr:thioether cross-link-forming SCIFF peptide maturase [Desulfotomaculaceae bacterium]
MVHTYSMNGLNIAIDGNSGGIHILDNAAFDLLIQCKDHFVYDQAAILQDKYSVEDIRESWEEINSLKEKGLLFSPEIEQTYAINDASLDNGVKALCLHVAHDCNLRCEYCFASKGNYSMANKLMPLEVAIKSVDFLINKSGQRKNVEIDFFGGEPLLNFDVVKKTVEYGRKVEVRTGKKFHFTITTNGMLLDDDAISYINENMDNVVISLDGRRKVHDAIRYDAAGKGSYEKILNSAMQLVRERGNKSYFIRGTFTSRNLDFHKDVFHLADLGFGEISMEPVVGAGEDFHIRKEHIPTILSEYERLAYAYIKRIKSGKPFRFYHFNINVYNGPCLYKRVTACGAGTEYFAVTPEGELYPCHHLVGLHEFKAGDLNTGIINDSLRASFRESNIFTKEECRKCWAKLFCSGGCHANAYYTNGNIMKPDKLVCEMQRKRVECAIMIEACRVLENQNYKE